jgi:hypothetical protein
MTQIYSAVCMLSQPHTSTKKLMFSSSLHIKGWW